ncbi:sigma 54-interacting transcriptional regulator [Lachnospiraceae bacterium ZAX-1]
MDQNELWRKFHKDECTRKHDMSSVAQEGWGRSLGYKIDYESVRLEPVDAKVWDKVKRQTKRLYVYANSIIDPMVQKNRNDDFGIMLFSKEGYLLHLYGTDSFQQWSDEMQIQTATQWSESMIGTNIFSVGIFRDGGTYLIGAENYASFLIQGAYYFAPIKLENGDLYGGVALAMPLNEQRDSFIYTAVSIARAIELQLFWFNTMEMYGEITEGHGLLTLDQSNGINHILIMSRGIYQMLHIPRIDLYFNLLEDVIDPLPHNKEFWNIINQKKEVDDKNIEIEVKGKLVAVNISTSGYHEKKFHMKGLIIAMKSFKHIHRMVSKYAGMTAHYQFEDIVGESTIFMQTINRCKTAARTGSNILLMGESGVGKELFAQAVHNVSKREQGPFVAVNCAAFSKELIVSELFGYESGAYTGAKKGGSIGKFELANQGTLFLDEIGDMPLDLQAVLLRVLENKSFMKVGGNMLIQTNVRIVAATNQNLTEKIEKGLFREDLFYRLGIVRIQIPPLRERGGDIMLLARHFVSEICARLGKEPVTLARDTASFFHLYHWPGNVRELQNLLEGLISTTDELVICKAMVRQYLGDAYEPPRNNAMQATLLLPEKENGERDKIIDALRQCRNNRSEAANLLGISRRTLYRRLKEYHLV